MYILAFGDETVSIRMNDNVSSFVTGYHGISAVMWGSDICIYYA